MQKPDISEFTSALAELFNSSAVKDTEQHVAQLLQSQIRKMGLVSREEFDAQKVVLENSRKRLQQLEEKLNQLSQ